jgi:hypothetical protein
MDKKKIPLTFITGNKKKLEEFLSIMSADLDANYTVTNIGLERKSKF